MEERIKMYDKAIKELHDVEMEGISRICWTTFVVDCALIVSIVGGFAALLSASTIF
jgi:hypothetical protein